MFSLQCTNGHLMCIACFSHLLADARLKDETATCPNCRCEISKASCSRNLAVEKAISELPAECQFCSEQHPRSELLHHEKELCQERCVVLSHLLLYKTPGVDGYACDDDADYLYTLNADAQGAGIVAPTSVTCTSTGSIVLCPLCSSNCVFCSHNHVNMYPLQPG